MFNKILVPLDGSDLAEKAIPYAKIVAKNKESELILFAVSPVTSADRQDKLLKAYLESTAKALNSPELKISIAVANGIVAEQISDFVEKYKIDLVVISTHGHSGIKRWMIGSVAVKVIHSVKTPVLLIKSQAASPEKAKIEKILLPVDGSPFSKAPIPYIEEIIRGTKAKVILLQAAEPPIVPSYEEGRPISPTWQKFKDDLWAQLEEHDSKNLKKLEVELASRGMNVTSQVVRGDAPESIIETAGKENVDLIVMSTHGRTGVNRWAFGSVASRIVEESDQPVLLIRPSIPFEPSVATIPLKLPS